MVETVEVETWVKVVVPAVFTSAAAVAGGVYKLWRHYSLNSKAIRYLLDAQRQIMHAMVPGPDRFLEIGELERHRLLIDQVRDELWVADGHDSARDNQMQEERIVRILTRTQAIKAKRNDQ